MDVKLGWLVDGATPVGQAIELPDEFFLLDGAGTPPAGQAIEPSVEADFGRLVEGAAPPGQAIAPDDGTGAGRD
jgi:hypothetical protein